jgi:hypothetical protein
VVKWGGGCWVFLGFVVCLNCRFVKCWVCWVCWVFVGLCCLWCFVTNCVYNCNA